MEQKIIIATDSSSDLNRCHIEKYDIKILPFSVISNETQYFDGVDINQRTLLENYDKTGKLPKTAARSDFDAEEFFRDFLTEDNFVIYIGISEKLSLNTVSAKKAAEKLAPDRIFCIDGLTLSSGTGLMVLKACQMREDGASAQQIFDEITKIAPNVQTSFVIEKLDFLYKGGRCSGLAAFFAGALSLRPTIRIQNGRMVVAKKYMGKINKIIDKYVLDTLKLFPNYDDTRVFITHCAASDECIEICKRTLQENTTFKEIIVSEASATISVHCGRGTLGILYLPAVTL